MRQPQSWRTRAWQLLAGGVLLFNLPHAGAADRAADLRVAVNVTHQGDDYNGKLVSQLVAAQLMASPDVSVRPAMSQAYLAMVLSTSRVGPEGGQDFGTVVGWTVVLPNERKVPDYIQSGAMYCGRSRLDGCAESLARVVSTHAAELKDGMIKWEADLKAKAPK